MKQKIAVLLSGELRTFVTAGPGILRFFEDYDVDYFVHTWYDNTWFAKTSDKSETYFHPTSTDIEPAQVNAMLAMFNPKKHKVEAKKEFPYIMPQSQFYSFAESHKLMRDYQSECGVKYDVVSKCRFDLVWAPFQKFTIPSNISHNNLFITHSDYEQSHNIPSVLDRFFFGNENVMNTMAGMYDKTCEMIAANPENSFSGVLLPEPFLHTFSSWYGLKHVRHHYFETIVRINAEGLHHANDFAAIHDIHLDFYK